jgi:hypothetical protein
VSTSDLSSDSLTALVVARSHANLMSGLAPAAIDSCTARAFGSISTISVRVATALA